MSCDVACLPSCSAVCLANLANFNTVKGEIDTMITDYDEALDTIWMILAGALVFFMHAGFSLLEAGTVRFKNTQNILAKNLLVVTTGFVCWWILGWPLALGMKEDPGKFAGANNFFSDGFWDDKTMFRAWFFQGAFCATAATIVSGSMAERTQLKGFVCFLVIMTSIIYPIVVYWGWSGSGFLSYANDDGEGVAGMWDGPSYMDFAGSGIVHMVGGVAALCGCAIVGARKDRYEDPDSFYAHSVPFCVLGTFCLWFGWYGFNPGSTGSMHDKDTAMNAGLVAVNTTLAPCAAGPLVFILRAFVFPPRRLDVGGFCNGILGGLVAITAGCNVVKPWESILIGVIAAFVYQGASLTLSALHIDDVVDAFAVHGACGFWGVLALGFFGNEDEGNGGNGLFYGGGQLGTQFLAAICIIVWTAILSTAVFLPLRLLGMLRLSDEFQDVGADQMEHSPSKAYAAGHVDS